MILDSDKTQDHEVEEIGASKDSGKMSIDAGSMGMLFDVLSKQIYSNPKGSIIREITSNCFDAHQEAGIREPVIVGREEREGSTYMFFEDFGVGMSPERFKNVYTKYMSSTKRDTNDQIGYFGLGSKSCFAYVDIFYVRTRYERIEYQYLIYKAGGAPDWDLMSAVPTDKRNGTQVSFEIEGGKYGTDVREFEKEIGIQLKYFDDVWVKGFPISNEYTILDFKTFKFRPASSGMEMHIILGKVTYPIDWGQLDREVINIPVGVKFDIGELIITPERESIRYNATIAEIINKRIDACMEELKSLMKTTYQTIEEVLTAKADSTKRIALPDGNTIPVYSGHYLNKKTKKYSLYPFKIEKPRWEKLKDYPISLPENPFFGFRTVGFILNGTFYPIREEHKKNKRLPKGYEDVYAMSQEFPIYRTNGFKNNVLKNKYIGSAVIITKKASYAKDKLAIKETILALGINKTVASGSYEVLNPKIKNLPVIGIDSEGRGFNKLGIIRKYKKVIVDLIVEKSVSYDTLVLPPDFITANKKVAVRKYSTEENLVCHPMSYGATTVKKRISRQDLRKKLVVYSSNKNKSYLYAIHQILEGRMTFNKKGNRVYGGIAVIAVNQTDLKHMNQRNMVSLHDFVTRKRTKDVNSKHKDLKNNSVFAEQATAYYLYRRFQDLSLSFAYSYVPSIEKHFNVLERFINAKTAGDNYIYHALENKFLQEILKMAKEEKVLIDYWIELLEGLEAVQDDLQPLKDILSNETLSDNHKRGVAKFLISKGYPVSLNLMYVPTEQEKKYKEFVEDNKFKYNNIIRLPIEELKKGEEIPSNHIVINNLKITKCPRLNFLRLHPNKLERISLLTLRVKNSPLKEQQKS